jgi:hypothetical protein
MLIVTLVGGAAQLGLATAANAQAQMAFIPSVSLFSVYDDNIFARVDGTAGQMLQLRPSFEGSYESPIVRLLGLYSFDMQRSNFSSLNTLDARRHALGETRLRTSPFTSLGLAMRYDRSETPGEIDIDTGLLGERHTAERLELTPSLARRLTPRTSVTTGYNWTTEHLVDGERGTLHTGRATLSREMTPRTTLTGTYVGRYFVDHIADHHSHALLFGWDRETAPGTRLSLSAGPKTTSYDGLDVEVAAAFARATNRIRTGVDYWHGETIVLGIEGPVAVDSVTTRVSWPFRHRFEFGTHAGVSDVGRLDGRTSTIYRGTLVGSWTPTDMYTFAATYGIDFQNGTIRNPVFLDGEPLPLEDRVLRHVFRVSVTVAPRYKRSILPPEEAARAKGVTR